MGGGARPGGTSSNGPSLISFLEGDPADVPGTLARDAGRLPIGLALGTKSNRGARRGATPYWRAISRPRSSGILYQQCQRKIALARWAYDNEITVREVCLCIPGHVVGSPPCA